MSNRACIQCGFENDPTRVFCQNCGTRLPVVESDGGAAATPATGKLFIPPSQQAPEAVRRPLKPVRVGSEKSKTIPRKPSVFGKLLSTAIFGAIAASAIQMMRSPEGIPAPSPVNAGGASDVYNEIRAAAENLYPRAVVLSQTQINNYLAARLVPVPDNERAFFQSKFERLFVMLGSGDYHLVIEQKTFQWPIFISLTQYPVRNGEFMVKTTGASIGRLPIHPLMAPLVERLFSPGMLASVEVVDSLRKAASIVITPSQVTMNWPGGGKTASP